MIPKDILYWCSAELFLIVAASIITVAKNALSGIYAIFNTAKPSQQFPAQEHCVSIVGCRKGRLVKPGNTQDFPDFFLMCQCFLRVCDNNTNHDHIGRVCVCVSLCSPLAASTQQQQHRDQQQGCEGAEGDGQDQLPTAQPRRHPGSSCRP